MIDWLLVRDWIVIVVTAILFLCGVAVMWANLKRDSKENSAGISSLRREFNEFKGSVVTKSMLSEYLERSAENKKDIATIKEVMMTVPEHAKLQASCQGNLIQMIASYAKEAEQTREIIRDVKSSVDNHIKDQNEQFTEMLVAIGTLGTKIDERTKRKEAA
jgi:hypothetical protein